MIFKTQRWHLPTSESRRACLYIKFYHILDCRHIFNDRFTYSRQRSAILISYIESLRHYLGINRRSTIFQTNSLTITAALLVVKNVSSRKEIVRQRFFCVALALTTTRQYKYVITLPSNWLRLANTIYGHYQDCWPIGRIISQMRLPKSVRRSRLRHVVLTCVYLYTDNIE